MRPYDKKERNKQTKKQTKKETLYIFLIKSGPNTDTHLQKPVNETIKQEQSYSSEGTFIVLVWDIFT